MNIRCLRHPALPCDNRNVLPVLEGLQRVKAYQGFIQHAVLMMVLVSVLPAAAQGAVYTVSVQDWLKIRHSDDLTSHPSLQAVMADWTSASPGSNIEIYHAEDQSHADWALELRNRLVAFGIPSQHLKLQIEDMDDTHFGLRVVRSRAAKQ
jgi:hypothetical protein